MELRHLRSFIALAEERHFGRAAARLHITQPSLSAQLQKLERSLEVTLVIRDSHRVELTGAGIEFAERVRTILTDLDTAIEATRSTAAGTTGSLKIGYNLPAGRHVLPAALRLLDGSHPEIVVSLWEKRSGPQVAAVVDGSLDVAFVYGRPVGRHIGSQRILSKVPIVVVVGRSHPWAGRWTVRCAELSSQHCLLSARDQCPAMYDALVSSAAEAGVSLSVAQTADDPGGTGQLVAAKPLVAFASRSRAIAEGMGTAGAATVAIKLIDPIPTVDLYMAWSVRSTNPAVGKFRDCVSTATDGS